MIVWYNTCVHWLPDIKHIHWLSGFITFFSLVAVCQDVIRKPSGAGSVDPVGSPGCSEVHERWQQSAEQPGGHVQQQI